MHRQVLEFFREQVSEDEIRGKLVLEVGSRNINGSVREDILRFGPRQYVGVDILAGKDVDEICDACGLVDWFGTESFDVVISTETLEHVEDWRTAIGNMKRVCKPGGLLLISTRSRRFHVHDYPGDYWRYEEKDVKIIFDDCEILALQKDEPNDGVLMKIRKPEDFLEHDLSEIKLFSIVDYLILKSRPFYGYLKHNLDISLVGAEVGVGEGTHSLYVSQLLKFKEYHLIDFWEKYEERGRIEDRYCLQEDRVRGMFTNKPHIIVHKMESTEAAKTFGDGYFDFIYLDANHDYEPVKRDIRAWLPKVRKGGLLGGHDYSSGWNTVVMAVNEIRDKLNMKFMREYPDWWFLV